MKRRRRRRGNGDRAHSAACADFSSSRCAFGDARARWPGSPPCRVVVEAHRGIVVVVGSDEHECGRHLALEGEPAPARAARGWRERSARRRSYRRGVRGLDRLPLPERRRHSISVALFPASPRMRLRRAAPPRSSTPRSALVPPLNRTRRWRGPPRPWLHRRSLRSGRPGTSPRRPRAAVRSACLSASPSHFRLPRCLRVAAEPPLLCGDLETRGEITATAYDTSGTRVSPVPSSARSPCWDRAADAAVPQIVGLLGVGARSRPGARELAFGEHEHGQCLASRDCSAAVRVWREPSPLRRPEGALAASRAALAGAAPWDLCADLGAARVDASAPARHRLRAPRRRPGSERHPRALARHGGRRRRRAILRPGGRRRARGLELENEARRSPRAVRAPPSRARRRRRVEAGPGAGAGARDGALLPHPRCSRWGCALVRFWCGATPARAGSRRGERAAWPDRPLGCFPANPARRRRRLVARAGPPAASLAARRRAFAAAVGAVRRVPRGGVPRGGARGGDLR